MKKEIKGLRKLSTEEMEKVSGGEDGCPGVQNAFELLYVLAILDESGRRAQADIIAAGFANGTLQYAPGCN